MDKSNFNFKTISFNVRGLNNRKKRRSIFKWIKQKRLDICFLQETFCTTRVENIWKNEWGGQIILSNGSNHARGVAILIKPGFDAQIMKVTKDDIGRMLLVDMKIQDTTFQLMNIYAPNSELNQLHFYNYIKNTLKNTVKPENNILIGGDFITLYLIKTLIERGVP